LRKGHHHCRKTIIHNHEPHHTMWTTIQIFRLFIGNRWQSLFDWMVGPSLPYRASMLFGHCCGSSFTKLSKIHFRSMGTVHDHHLLEQSPHTQLRMILWCPLLCGQPGIMSTTKGSTSNVSFRRGTTNGDGVGLTGGAAGSTGRCWSRLTGAWVGWAETGVSGTMGAIWHWIGRFSGISKRMQDFVG
jgi:hypothetical protein